MSLFDGAAGIDDADALRLCGGDLEIGITHARVKVRVLGFEAVSLVASLFAPA